MKKLLYVFALFGILISMSACTGKCEQHVYDDCVDTICNVCGVTRDSMHAWKNADCTNPKICLNCEKTEGEPLGHTPDSDDSNCETAIKCIVCNEIAVEANEHKFSDEYECNELQHWHKCLNDGCNMTDEKIDHTPDRAHPTIYAPKKCSVCEYEIEPKLTQNSSEQAIAMFKRYFCDSQGFISIYSLDDENRIWASVTNSSEEACEIFKNLTGLNATATDTYTYSYLSDDETVSIKIVRNLEDDEGVYATLYVTIPGYEWLEQIKLATLEYIESVNN